MGYDIMSFRNNIGICISLCEQELQNRKKGIKGESSIEQIEDTILPELNQLLKKIDYGQLPPKPERYLLSFANAFKVWGWNMQQPTELFVQLVKLDDAYKKI
ncbi:MAG: hypothetical protein ABFD25_00270 [Clostridiaceae bacterium]